MTVKEFCAGNEFKKTHNGIIIQNLVRGLDGIVKVTKTMIALMCMYTILVFLVARNWLNC